MNRKSRIDNIEYKGNSMKKSIKLTIVFAVLAMTNVVHAADSTRVLCFGDSITDLGERV